MNDATSAGGATTIAAMDTKKSNKPGLLGKCLRGARLLYDRVPMALLFLPVYLGAMLLPMRSKTMLPLDAMSLAVALAIIFIFTMMMIAEIRHVAKLPPKETGIQANNLKSLVFWIYVVPYVAGMLVTILLRFIIDNAPDIPIIGILTLIESISWMFSTGEFLLLTVTAVWTSRAAMTVGLAISLRSSEIADNRGHSGHED